MADKKPRYTEVDREGRERPKAGPPTIGIAGELSVLCELYAIERARLAVAVDLEKRRDIVFPETTVILRDVERLLGKIRALEGTAPDGRKKADKGDGDPVDALMQDLR